MRDLIDKIINRLPGTQNTNLTFFQKTAIVIIAFTFSSLILIRIIRDLIINF